MSEKFKKIAVYVLLYIITLGIFGSVVFTHPRGENSLPILRDIIIFFAAVLLTKYFVYMFVSPWHDFFMWLKHNRLRAKKDKKTKRKLAYEPLVSVLIPAWNEEVGLVPTIHSLLRNTYKKIEIVVVNDGSTDSSDAMMKKFIKNYEQSPGKQKAKLIYSYKENGGKGSALNAAITLATGDIIMSIDADCVVTETAVQNFVKHFEDPKVMAAVGNVKIGNTSHVVGVVQHLEFLFSFYFKRADSVMNCIYIIGGAAGAFRKEVFEKLGMYNTTNITEDIELSMRIQNSGMKIVYASDAVVYTEGAATVSGLIKQRLRWKRGRFQTFWHYRRMFFSFRREHNKILSWIILPLALFGDLQLSLELFFLAFLYVYSYLVRDYTSFISGIIVVSSMFFIQMLFEEQSSRKWSFFLLAPIGWMLFYLATFVEYNALIRAIWYAARKREVTWQRWQRKGALDNALALKNSLALENFESVAAVAVEENVVK